MDDPEHYRLTLTSDGAVVMQDWWPDRAIGERKFLSWIGSYSAVTDARIVLTERGDDGEERVLQRWPSDEA
ncbi:hypothetical protein [Streptomyces sp. NBC_00063]|uniref:hypothetical protein n=1 Tax=Streptomyces sp. NBC_00063 TaxID=2975638 RepID=UPI0022583C9C|nr:hypothetical protein [Streptomyces sp. NBC_00063]MCX5441168.1 hypothetical protein [Streptomyces sp. NBC_00063]